MTTIVPNNQKLNLADIFQNDVGANSYYFFIGDHVSNSTPVDLFDYDRDTLVDCYHNMIMGQKITSNNVAKVIRNIPYTPNMVYDPYDDSDKFLSEKDFYVVVDESAYFHVYKCLDNNLEALSTVTPTFSDISGANTNFYRTSDGYIWKYMYSVTSADKLKFSSTDFFPVVANTTVSNSAVAGAIDIIDIDDVGRGYDNYLYGTLSIADIGVDGNTLIYSIVNSVASSVNTFYTGCMVYLSGGTGAGQYRTVTDYFVNITGKYVTLDSAFTTAPTNGTTYQITPKVNIFGSGDQTVNAAARALINASSSNSIFRIEMMDRGAGYSYVSANVYASPVVSIIREAVLKPVYSPSKGHGYDAARELFSHHFVISSTFNSNNLTVNTNSFSQIGILKNPTFSTTTFTFVANVAATFVVGEKIYKIEPVQINTAATLSTTNAILSCNTANFNNQVTVGTCLYLNANNSNQLATVNSIINATAITLTTNGFFSSTDTTVYLANKGSYATINYITNTTSMNVSSISVGFNGNDTVIGQVSGGLANVTTLTISNVAKSLDTFISLYKYDCSVVSGTYTPNELVYQGNVSSANAYLHSAIVDGANVTIYTSNQVGSFVTSGTITGTQSVATATINNKYGPEIVFGSGQVLYLENIVAKSRANSAAETIKTIFEF